MPTISFDDMHLHYEVHGSGPPIFLHHGLGGSSQYWYRHLPWLTKKYQVIIHDARGHALSTAPADYNRYSWEIMADDLHQLMEHLGIQKAIVGGLSMGCGVSHAFALKYPQKIRALILSDCAGTGMLPKDTPPNFHQLMARQLESGEQVVREYGVMEHTYRALAEGNVMKPIIGNSDYENQYLERMARFPFNGFINANRFVMQTAIKNLEKTRELKMPTLVLIGEEDVALQAGAEWLRDTLPNRRYVFITKVGHSIPWFKPEAWRKAVEDFLDDFEKGKDIRKEITL